MKNLIIFDWDDTIVTGCFNLYFNAYRGALERVGAAEAAREERYMVLQLWGKPHRDVLQRLLGKHRLHLLDEAERSYLELLLAEGSDGHIEPLPKAVSTLKGLWKEYSLAVASGGNPTVIRERLIPRFGLEGVFSTVITTSDLDDPTRGKPDPYLLRSVLEREGVAAEEAVYVGDSELDVLMARAAGVEPVAVLTGRLRLDEAKRLDLKGSHILGSIAELPGLLEGLGHGR